MRRSFFYLLPAIHLAIVLGSWWNNSGALFGAGLASDFLALGRAAGLLAASFVLLQFSLMERNIWLERTFGLDRLAQLHRTTGVLAGVFILIHPVLITTAYSLANGIGPIAQLADFFGNYDGVLRAFFAAILFAGVVALSLVIVRRRLRYETWYFAHLLVYIAVALVWGHQFANGGDFLADPRLRVYWAGLYAVVFGSLFVFRFLRPLWLFYRHRFRVTRTEMASPDATSVYIAADRIESFRIKPGQFLKYRFLAPGFWWENHPFSVSLLPTGNEFRLTAKNLGDFTARLRDLTPGTPVFVDGPFGVFRPKRPAGKKFLFLAGGIGITPIRTILEDLPADTDSMLLYGNRTERDIVFRRELDELAASKKLVIHHVLSDAPDFAGEKGRIDLERIRRLVPDFAEREIFLCGPPPMLNGLRKELRNAGISGRRVRYEKFSLH